MKSILQKRYTLSPLVSFLLAILLAGIITVLVIWCQPNSCISVLAGFRRQPLLILLNALPVGLFLLTFSFLFKNVFFGAAITDLLIGLLSVANRIKIVARDEPVFPRDLSLLKELGRVVEDYSITYPVARMAVIIGFGLLLILAGVFFRSRFPAFAEAKAALWRILGAAISAAVTVALILTVYASNSLYNSFSCSNPYYVPAVFNELGFPYCFCHHFTTYTVDKPEGFDRGEAEAWDSAAVPTDTGRPVHVIFVMNEAFSDLTDDDDFCWTPETDPLKNLHAMQQDPHAITGHVIVPGFAAGTANTEFDVLTGIQTNALSATTSSALRAVNGNVVSLFRLYAQAGYRVSFFHPGDDWFYNRENVYHWFGAENTVFIDQMTDMEYKGRWVTDHSMTGLIESEFESAVENGELLFHYTTTIQNHMAYSVDKYGADHEYPAIACRTVLSDTAESLLSVYTEGVRDADAMLGDLREYFAGRSEPVVLVFFGDHLPSLGDNQLTYRELGMTEEENWDTLRSFETPYVIWANDAAAQTLDWETAVAAADIPDTLSAGFLGVAVADLTGHSSESPWFSFLDGLRREIPVVQKQTVLLADGTLTDAPSDELAAEILKWRQWSYYNLKCAEIP